MLNQKFSFIMFDGNLTSVLHRLDGLEIQNQSERHLEDGFVEFHLWRDNHLVFLNFHL